MHVSVHTGVTINYAKAHWIKELALRDVVGDKAAGYCLLRAMYQRSPKRCPALMQCWKGFTITTVEKIISVDNLFARFIVNAVISNL